MYTRISESFATESFDADRSAVPASEPLALAGFGPAHGPAPPKRNRAAGIAGVIAMHALLALGYVFAAPVFTKAEGPSYVTVVSLPPEIEKPIEPKPVVPEFAPPPVYVPTAIIPEIQLTIPTPPPVITIPDKPPTAPTAPMVAPPAPPPVISGESQQAFAERLFKHLNAYKRYPASARLRHQEGVVSVRFTMDRSGRVLSFEVVKSSGAAVLDQEARDLVKRAEPLPFIPAEFWRDTLDLVVPIEFFLR